MWLDLKDKYTEMYLDGLQQEESNKLLSRFVIYNDSIRFKVK